MKKRNAVLTLVVVIVLTIAFGFMVVYGVGQDKVGAASEIKLGLDLAGGVSITYQAVGEGKPSNSDMDDTMYKLQKRVEGYSTEAQVYKEGDDRINIEIPGVEDANAVLTELGKPGQLYFIAQYDNDGNPNYNGGMLTKSIEELQADGSIVLEGTDVQAATGGAYQDELKGVQYIVELTLTPEGTRKFADATTKAVKNQ